MRFYAKLKAMVYEKTPRFARVCAVLYAEADNIVTPFVVREWERKRLCLPANFEHVE